MQTTPDTPDVASTSASEATPDRLELNLPQFHGPLDLLLHLIQKNDLDIHEISIAQITDQYLEYIDLMKMLDLDVASDYLVMASTLLYLKSRSMLPSAASARRGSDGADMRDELVRQLLEYKHFKEAAVHLHEREEARAELQPRVRDESFDGAETREYRVDATLFDLLSAFKMLVDQPVGPPPDLPDEIEEDLITVEDKIREVLHRVETEGRIAFGEFFARFQSRLELICTFLAILELARTHQVYAVQEEAYGPIEIELNPERPDITSFQWTDYGGPEEVEADD